VLKGLWRVNLVRQDTDADINAIVAWVEPFAD